MRKHGLKNKRRMNKMLFQELIQVYQTNDDFNIRCDAEQQIKDMVNNAIKNKSYLP